MSASDLSQPGWRKSSYCGMWHHCVEVAFADSGVAVRDSKNPTGSVLTVPSPAWNAFTTALRAGDLD